MSVLKEINDMGAVIAWSQTQPKLVAATLDGGGSKTFDEQGGEMIIYDMDPNKTSSSNIHEMHVVNSANSVKTKLRFTSLAWSGVSTSGELIAGGLADGSIKLWDPESLGKSQQIKSTESDLSVATIDKHKVACRALQFNPLKPNLLASGGGDRQVCIIDLSHHTNPIIYGPSSAPGDPHVSDITAVAWNTQVNHIVASCAADGCTVWDLREKKAWCRLRGGSGAFSALAWNPSNGLQLMTACEDSPILKLFDLRTSTTTPESELVGHNAGILSMSWSTKDDGLITSCGKDNKIILWDSYMKVPIWEGVGDLSHHHHHHQQQQQIVAPGSPTSTFGHHHYQRQQQQQQQHFYSASQAFSAAPVAAMEAFNSNAGYMGSSSSTSGNSSRHYQVAWSPVLPGILGTCSFDRRVHIVSLIGAGSTVSNSTGEVLNSITRPPQWLLKKQSGVSFAFGGKLVEFGKSGVVTLSQVSTNSKGSSDAAKFDAEVTQAQTIDYHNGNLEAMKALCLAKSAQAENIFDKESWIFMSVLFEKNDARPFILNHLGFPIYANNNEPLTTAATTTTTNTNATVPPPYAPTSTPSVNSMMNGSWNTNANNNQRSHESAADVFSSSIHSVEDMDDTIPRTPDPPVATALATKTTSLEPAPPVNDVVQPLPLAVMDDLVKKSIISGNFEAAVSRSFELGQYADALAFAIAASYSTLPEIVANAQRQYLETQSRYHPFMNTVSAIMTSQFPEMIHTSDIRNGNWKETLAILTAYAQTEQDYSQFCGMLGTRLEQELRNEEGAAAAVVCFMLARDINKTIELWIRYGKGLESLAQKAIIFRSALPDPNALLQEASLMGRLAAYAESLAEEGQLEAALKYAEMSQDAYLIERIKQTIAILEQEEQLRLQQQQQQQQDAYYYQQQQHAELAPVYGGSSVQAVSHERFPVYEPYQQPYQQPPLQQQPYQQPYQQPQQQPYQQPPLQQQPYQQPQQQPQQQPYQPPPLQQQQQQPYQQPQQQPYQPPPLQQQQQQHLPYQQPYQQQPQQTYPTPPRIKENDGFHTTAGNPEAGAKFGNLPSPYAAPPTPVVLPSPVVQPQQPPADMIPALNTVKQVIEQLRTIPGLNAAEKKLISDAEHSDSALSGMLANGTVSPDVQARIKEIAYSLQTGNYAQAKAITDQLTLSSWEQHKPWLKGWKSVTAVALKRFGATVHQ